MVVALKEHTYLVTGACGGLGRVVAMHLVERGARPVLIDRDRETLRGLAAALGGVPAMACDLTDFSAVQQLVEQEVIRFGAVTGLIHLVGGFSAAPVVDTIPEDYDRLLDLNMRTLYNMSRAVLPLLREQGYGLVLGIGAGPGLLRGTPGMALYSAAKGAATRFLEALADEVANEGIGVSVIHPMGAIDTPANRAAMPDANPTDWIAPEDVARAISFAASLAGRRSLVEIPVWPPAR
ncbi:MAG: SDR family NAD(P)-dependent oxidoreductase [Candidatus Dadabacteria bacterium]|nr:MAG: SDR family NAD(P)-dependent oxidoreductase [Candidatus Dadabacteria bacterium]